MIWYDIIWYDIIRYHNLNLLFGLIECDVGIESVFVVFLPRPLVGSLFFSSSAFCLTNLKYELKLNILLWWLL